MRTLIMTKIGFFLSLAFGSHVVAAETDTGGMQFFERKIRPILVQHCYQCHSATAKKLGGKLLLDSRDGILRGGESGPALVVGKVDESLIIQAIRGTEEDLSMPPEEESPLPKTVVHDFEKWIEMGAPDPRVDDAAPSGEKPPQDDTHWSFSPISNPKIPDVHDTHWPLDAIDHFVLARLEKDGHQPVGDALPEVMIRRLYFDLIGLAPTIGHVRAFVSAYQSDGQKAVEQLVDRLFASPQFGERWGRHWLDVARYGESNGNDGLGRNPTFPHAWRYRDYVIQSFNDDTPYNRFLKEQIAGDLLPVTTATERNRNLVATGFLAIGFKPAVAMNNDFAMDVVDDQIDVVSTAVMGLSVSCARCHDHKHDPIPTRDYYAMAGIFTSTETMWGKAGNEKLTAPPTPLHALRDTLKAPAPKAKTKAKPKPAGDPPPKFAKGYGAVIDKLKPALHARLDVKPEGVTLQPGVTISDKTFAKINDGRLAIDQQVPADTYSISFWFRNDLSNTARAITTYLFSHAADGDDGQNGDNLGIGGTHEAGRSGKLFIWTGKAKDQNLLGRKVIAPGSWNHLVLVRSGKTMRVYLNGDTKPEIVGEIAVAAPENRKLFVGARNDRFAPLKGFLAELAVFDRALTAEEAQRLHSASGQKPGTREAPKPAFAMGVRDKGAIADCKINIDGNSKKLGPLVPRGFLSACETQYSPPTIGTGSSGRLQLADWLTRGDHPQTARVMANRIWLHLFGRAIVTTPDDFGLYGARPSHPELLDHLATRFMVEHDWSMKKLIRAIVLSRTYQLDSRSDDEDLLKADPDNILLGRHSRRRLDAESLRDRILQASGKLNLKPAQGSAIDDLVQLINWPPGEAKYLHEPSLHRSVYLCMLRSSPPPDLAAFDFPDGIDPAGQRQVTTPPTHALFLLNNPLVVEQARVLAEENLRTGDNKARVIAAYHRTLQRDPSPDEIERSLGHIRQLGQELAGGDAQLRAWASFTQSLLASNEFRYID
jgi:hypothetical protein